MPSHFKYKVYIIDEVHMLSTSAFNACLKHRRTSTHVVFILATTEPHKIPMTPFRCQRFDFKPLTTTEIKNKLKKWLKMKEFRLKTKH